MKIKLWLRPLIHYKVGMLQWWTVVLVTTEACLNCVPEVNDKLGEIANTPEEKTEIAGLNKLHQDKTHLWGVIDLTSLYKAKTLYLNAFAMIQSTSAQNVDKFSQSVKKWVDILEDQIKKSNIPKELCPNMCGLLQRRVMDCKTCKYKIHSCPSLTGKVDCGEYKIQAVERDQVLLDCFQQWHSLMSGRAFYIWTNGTKVIRGDSDETRSLTDDSKLVLNQIRLSDKGTYRCTLKNSRTVFFRTVMHVTVIKAPIETQPSNVTMPTLISGDTEIFFQSSWSASVVPLMAVITALCLAGSLILIVVIG
ncbi:izumo sperm-egg fusion protein 1 isoform 2-T3 [Syngnathus typhle]